MHRSYPVPEGSAIAELEPGDEIVIKAGFGNPAKEEDTTDIIADVDGFSALTAAGVTLSCWDGNGIEKTGNHFEDYEISAEALAILEEVGALTEEEE